MCGYSNNNNNNNNNNNAKDGEEKTAREIQTSLDISLVSDDTKKTIKAYSWETETFLHGSDHFPIRLRLKIEEKEEEKEDEDEEKEDEDEEKEEGPVVVPRINDNNKNSIIM